MYLSPFLIGRLVICQISFPIDWFLKRKICYSTSHILFLEVEKHFIAKDKHRIEVVVNLQGFSLLEMNDHCLVTLFLNISIVLYFLLLQYHNTSSINLYLPILSIYYLSVSIYIYSKILFYYQKKNPHTPFTPPRLFLVDFFPLQIRIA